MQKEKMILQMVGNQYSSIFFSRFALMFTAIQ